MAKNTYIKLFRSIEAWEWYTDSNTFRVFVHLLLNANVTPCRFKGIEVQRGELVTSYGSIAESLKLTLNQVRTSFLHLKSTGEITVKIYPKYQLVKIENYDKFQSASQAEAQSDHRQVTGKSQQYKNERIEEVKNNTFTIPTVDEIADYCRERRNSIDAEEFWAFYESKGWKVGNAPMKSWKSAIITWEKRHPEKVPQSQPTRKGEYDE